MKRMNIVFALLLGTLTSCGPASKVNVDTHGDKIDEHELRLDLIEAVNKLQDEALATHDARLTALESRADGSDGEIASLQSGLDAAIKQASGDLAAAVAGLEQADADNLAAVMLEIKALQLALDANSALDDSRYGEISDALAALDQRISDEARYSAQERRSMKREYRSKYRSLKSKLRAVRSSLSSRISSLRGSLNRYKDRTNGRLDDLEDELFRVCEEPQFALFQEEECVDGILARLDGLDDSVDENSEDIDDLQRDLRRTNRAVAKNKKKIKKNKRAIADLGEDLDEAVSDLEQADQDIMRALRRSHGQLSSQISSLQRQLNVEKFKRFMGDLILHGRVNRLLSTVSDLSDRLSTVEDNYQTATDVTNAITNALISINQQIAILEDATDDDVEDLQGQIDALTQALEDIELTPGPQGEQGEQGEQGPAGQDGKDGDDGDDGEDGEDGDDSVGNVTLSSTSVSSACKHIGNGMRVKYKYSSVRIFTSSGCSGSGLVVDSRHVVWSGNRMFYYISSSSLGIMTVGGNN